MNDMPQDFEAMKSRLDEIADEVSVEGISLDDALALYEEAVKLGLAACDVSEADILMPEEAEEGPEGAEVVGEGAIAVEGASENADAVADAVAPTEAVEAVEGGEEAAAEVAPATDSEENDF